jgi:hypothetical protein
MIYCLVNVLQLGVAVALASVTSLPTTSAPVLATAVAELCQEVTAEPAKAKVYYNELLAKLNENQKAEETFSNTLAYLNNSTNKKEFLASVQDCIQFFAGLKAPLLADYEATGLSLQAAEEKVARRLADFIAKIQAHQK